MALGIILANGLPAMAITQSEMVEILSEEMTANHLYSELAKKYPEYKIFSKLAESEGRHMESLKRSASRLGLSIEEAKIADIKIPETKEEALVFALAFEQEDIDMLEKLIAKEEDARTKRVLNNLLKGSKNHHSSIKEGIDKGIENLTYHDSRHYKNRADNQGQRGGLGQGGQRQGKGRKEFNHRAKGYRKNSRGFQGHRAGQDLRQQKGFEEKDLSQRKGFKREKCEFDCPHHKDEYRKNFRGLKRHGERKAFRDGKGKHRHFKRNKNFKGFPERPEGFPEDFNGFSERPEGFPEHFQGFHERGFEKRFKDDKGRHQHLKRHTNFRGLPKRGFGKRFKDSKGRHPNFKKDKNFPKNFKGFSRRNPRFQQFDNPANNQIDYRFYRGLGRSRKEFPRRKEGFPKDFKGFPPKRHFKEDFIEEFEQPIEEQKPAEEVEELEEVEQLKQVEQVKEAEQVKQAE